MTAKELQNKLDEAKKSHREAEQELRKQIAKQKRKERNDLIKAVGEFMVKKFPDFTTVEQFETVLKNTETATTKPAEIENSIDNSEGNSFSHTQNTATSIFENRFHNL